MNTVENGTLTAPARYGQQASSDRLWIYERNRRFHLLAWEDDVDCVIKEISEQFMGAIRHGSAELVGRVVLAAVGANLDRLAARDVDMDLRSFPEPEMAVIQVLLMASADANEGRKGS